MNANKLRILGTILLLGQALALLARPASAASEYFTDAGGPYTWINSSGTGWSSVSGGPYTSAWSGYNDAVFEGTGGTVNISGPQVNNITFNVNGYYLNGNTINLGSPSTPNIGNTITVAAGDTATITSTFVHAGGYTNWTKAGAGQLIFSGADTGTNGVAVTGGTLTYANVSPSPGTISTVSGAMTQIATGNSQVTSNAVTFTGAGTVQKTGTSTYIGVSAGNTTINMSPGGLIDVEQGIWSSTSYSTVISTTNSGSLNVASGGTMGMDGSSSGGIVPFDVLSGSGSIPGPYTSSTLTLGVAGGSGTWAGVIGAPNHGGWSVNKTGSGIETFIGANAYTGQTTVSAGTLQIGNGGSTGSLASTTMVDNAALIYNLNSSANASLPSTFSGSGNVTAAAGVVQFNGNVTVGGSQSYTQVGSTALYHGLYVPSNTTLTAGSISMVGDVGNENTTANLVLSTSAVNGPISLNISLGRGSVWYNLTSFTATAGTGAINVLGTNGYGWNTPVSLTGALNISGNVVIPTNDSVTLHATANSTISATFDLSQSIYGYNSFTVDSGATMTVSGQLIGVSGYSWGGFNKLGGGTLVLTNSTNNYSQGMELNGGIVQFSNNALSAWNSGDSTRGYAADFQSNSTLQWGTGNTTDISGNGTTSQIKIEDGVIATFDTNGNNETFSTAFDLGTNQTGGLAKVGAGMLTLSKSNGYSGGTTVSGGTLQLGNVSALGNSSGSLTVNGGTLDINGKGPAFGTVTLAGGSIINSGATATLTGTVYNVQNGSIGAILGGGGTVALNKTTGGLVTLGAANTYGGGTTISAGTLGLLSGGSLGSGSVTIVPGAVLDTSALTSGYTIGGGTLIAGRAVSPAADINGSLTLNNATLSIVSPSASGTLTVSNGSLTLNGATLPYVPGDNIAIGGGLTLSGTDYIVPTSQLSAGTTTLFTYTGMAPNTADLATSGFYGTNPRQTYTFNASAGALTLAVSGVAGQLQWTGAGSGVWYSGTSSTANWYNATSGTADYFYTNDNVTFSDSGSNPQSITISGSVAPASLTVSNTAVNYSFTGGTIAGVTSLVKNGPGTLTLANSGNVYTDGTAIQGGLLALGIGNALPTGGGVTFGASGTSGTLDLAGFNQTVAGLAVSSSASSAGQTITTSSGNVTLTYSGGASAFAGSIQDTAPSGGTLGLTVSGGTLTLGGANTYSGGTTVASGLLKAANPSALGFSNTAATAVVVQSGATVDINGSASSGNFFYGFTIAGTGTSGQGALVNNGANGNSNWVQTPNIALSANATIGGTGDIYMIASGDGPDMLTLAGNTLTKSGSNTLWLSNTTVTAGTVSVTAGTLSQVAASNGSAADFVLSNSAGVSLNLGGLPFSVGSISGGGTTGGSVVLGSGTLTIGGDNNSPGAYAGVISGGGGITKVGSGTLSLNGANTYTGPTTINGGKVIINGSISSSSPVIANSGAFISLVGNNATSGAGSSTGTYTINGGTISNDGAASTTQVINGNLTLNGGLLAATSSFNTTDGNFVLFTNNGPQVIVIGSSTSTISAVVSLAGNHTFNVGPGSVLNVPGRLIGNSGNLSGEIIKTGAGTLYLSNTANNSNAGGTLALTGVQLNAGNVTFVNGGLGNGVTYGGGPVGLVADFTGNSTLTWAAGNTQDISGSGLMTIQDGVTATLNTNGNNVTLGTAITLGTNKTGSLVLNDTAAIPGTLTISASNNYAGGTSITGGVLQVGNSAALGMGALAANGGTLDLHGYAVTVPSFSGSLGAVTSSTTGTTTFTVNQSGSTTFGGQFQNGPLGYVALNLTGSGGLTLSGANTLITASVNNSSGMLTIAGGGSLTANDLNVNAGQIAGNGTINLNFPGGGDKQMTYASMASSTFGGTIVGVAGDGGITVNSGALTLGGSNNFTGGATVNGGLLVSTNASGLGSGPAFVYGGTLDVTAAAQTIASLSIGSSGTLNLALANPLSIAGNVSLAASSAININGAISSLPDLLMTYTGTETGTFGIVDNNGSLLSASDKLQYTGGSIEVVQSTTPTTYNLAAAVSASLVHVGHTATVTATITNAGTGQADSLNYAGLNISGSGAYAITGGSASGNLMTGSSGSVTLSYTASVPGMITLTPIVSGGTNATLGGNATLGTTSPASISVFSGNGIWNGSTGSWGTHANSNWTDANGFGVAAAPGTFSDYQNTDTATFSGSGSVTSISLSGANPSLAALSFSNTGYSLTDGTLTLNSGSGTASITVSGGSTSIGSLLSLASSADVFVSGDADQLTLAGPIVGSGGLSLSGDGTLVLSNSNNYSGGTTVSTGTLVLDNTEAIADGTSLTVGDPSEFGGIVANGQPLAAAGHSSAQPSGEGGPAITAVPEPGTLALLAVSAMLACVAACRRRRK